MERVSIAENEANNRVGARFGVFLHQWHKMSHAPIFKAKLAQGANDESANCLHIERVAAHEKVSRAVFVAVFTGGVRFEAASGFCGVGCRYTHKTIVMITNSANLATGEKDSVNRQGNVSEGRAWSIHIEKASFEVRYIRTRANECKG